MEINLHSRVRLNNGVEMPLIGMGTYPLNGWRLGYLMMRAIYCGYRCFDTASIYHNEQWLGRGMRLSGVPRNKFFISSKLSNVEQRAGDVRKAVFGVLERLKTNYLDLYLLHWPNPDTYLNSYQQMVDLYHEGVIRAIGVANCHQHHLESLLEISDVTPAVNQVEMHPLLSQQSLRGFCRSKDIQMESYSPVARMHEKLIGASILKQLADKYTKSVPQIILRWNIQNGIIPIPKASSSRRLKENINVFNFSLSEEDMVAIDSLNCDFRVRHDPDNCDFNRL